jgi:type II secretory pathway pseudopilin PulG
MLIAKTMKFLAKIYTPQTNHRGDTIVEVMVSMLILSLVLAAAFGSSSKSLQTGTDASNREQALRLAQDQVEHIRNEANKVPSGLGGWPQSQYYCILPSGAVDVVDVDTTTHVCYNLSSNKKIGASIYYVAPPSGVYTVKAKWNNSNGGINELTLYYKAAQ